MKPTFKGARPLLGGPVLAGSMLLWSTAAPAAPNPDSLGYTFRAPMTNSGVEPGVSGTVLGSENRRGSADKQRLAVIVYKLHATTPYHLVVYPSGSVTSSIVADFTADRSGRALGTFVKGQTRGGLPLPAVMDPISDLSALAIVNGNADTVLRSQFTDPAAFSYSVRRSMDNTGFLTGADGLLRLNGSTHVARVSVVAKHLTPRTPYRLTVNGVDARTKISSRAGTLSLSGPKVGLPLVLDIRTVALVESTGTNIILIASKLGIPSVVPTLSPAPVALGAAANYGALAGSTVTSTGATVVHGDLGVSPGTAVTGFPPGTVTGAIHAGDSAAAQAQLDLTVAYNDAAGRTSNAVNVAGNLGGLTLTPGLYKSTSSLEISSGDLTLDAQGVTNAVFIFQIASTLTTTSGRRVILSGGARAANIIWQVGSSATLGTSSIFKGTILALTAISVATGATVEGRLLARNAAVTFDGNIVGNIPADTTAPTLSSLDPSGSAIGTAINRRISATFSELIDPSTLNTATFRLWQGATPVPGTVTCVGRTAIFTPDSSLSTNTTYIAAITGGVTDLAGNAMGITAQWSFTTGVSLDDTAPFVNFVAPADGATAVAPNTKITAAFSEGMDPATINTTQFTVSQGSTPVAGTVAYSAVGKTAIFSPVNTLAPLTSFTATVGTGTRDLAGNPELTNFVWSFTTGEALETNATVVLATVPANAATGVPANQSISATFNASMDPATINTETFVLAGPGPTPVPGIVAYDATSRMATFAPAGVLAPDTAYTATITTGAKSLAGNGLAANLDWGFTTVAIPPGQPLR